MADLNIHELLQKEVSRKEFLRYVGAAILGVIGVTQILNSLQKSLAPPKKIETSEKVSGYGMTPYGR